MTCITYSENLENNDKSIGLLLLLEIDNFFHLVFSLNVIKSTLKKKIIVKKYCGIVPLTCLKPADFVT